jgi:hypothetical protein
MTSQEHARFTLRNQTYLIDSYPQVVLFWTIPSITCRYDLSLEVEKHSSYQAPETQMPSW